MRGSRRTSAESQQSCRRSSRRSSEKSEEAPPVRFSLADDADRKEPQAGARPSAANVTQVDETIHSCPVFKECSYDFVEEVLLDLRKSLVRPGQSIVEEGSPSPASMFWVLWGEADMTYKGEASKELKAGDYFGVVQMLGLAKSWRYSVVARNQCMVVELPGAVIQRLVSDYPEEERYFSGVVSACHAARDQRDTWRALRRCAILRDCSEAFLVELDAAAERHVLFPTEAMIAEGSQDSALYVLERGLVSVEVAGRAVRQEEVPFVRTKLSYGEDFGLLGDNKARSEGRSGDRGELRHNSFEWPDGTPVLAAKRELPESKDTEVTDEAEGIPEAVVFGEASVLGIVQRQSCTYRARKLCDVRIIHKRAFHSILAKHQTDQELLAPFTSIGYSTAFPRFDASQVPQFRDVGLSKAFYRFLEAHLEERIFAPGMQINLDDLHRNIHPPVPDENASTCVLNVGVAEVCEDSNQRTSVTAGALIDGRSFLWKTVKAIEACFVTILHRGVIAKALEELPADRDLYLPVLTKAQGKQSREDGLEKVATLLRERSIFAQTSLEFLKEIGTHGKIRVFMPGDSIIQQGTDGRSMFILWVGTANVVVEKLEENIGRPTRTLRNVGTLAHGSVFGELVMLGVQTLRTASIIATTICCSWEVEHNGALSILDRHPVERQNFIKLVEEHLGKLAAPRIIYHKLFSDFHQQFRTLIGVNCERKLYFPGEAIIRKGSAGERMYVINLGTAVVQAQGTDVLKVKDGAHFGFANVSVPERQQVLEKYPVSVISLTMCQVLIVTRSSYQHALNKYPEMRDVSRKVASEDKVRVRRQLESLARMVAWRRKSASYLEALRGSIVPAAVDDSVSNMTLLESAFEGWNQIRLRSSEIRREDSERRNLNASRIEAWLTKRKGMLEKIQHKVDLKHLIDENLNERGPLKLAKKAGPKTWRAQRGHNESYYSAKEDSVSPYMSPCPVWVRTPQTARQRERLPKLGDVHLMSSSNPWTGFASARAAPATTSPNTSGQVCRTSGGDRQKVLSSTAALAEDTLPGRLDVEGLPPVTKPTSAGVTAADA